MAFSIGKKLAGAALAGVVALGAGVGAVAWASDSGSPAPTASTAPALSTAAGAKAGKGRAGLAILRRADHGDIEVPVKGAKGAAPTFQTVTFDRGNVSDVAADHITVARPDGQSVTLKIVASTKFRGATSWQAVQKGKPAVVVSKDGTATQVLQAKAAPAAG